MASSFDVDELPAKEPALARTFILANVLGALLLEDLTRNGKPPQLVWLTCGNTSNARLREILESAMADIRVFIDAGEPLVELGDKR